MSPSADRDAQIAVLFSDIQQLMQPPSTTVSASAATISVPVETLAPTPIYSNVLSHTVLANPTPPLVLPRVESSLSSHSSTITDGGSKGIDHETRVITNENLKGLQNVLQLCTKQVGTREMIKYKRELKQKGE